jgi:hypothetical protein
VVLSPFSLGEGQEIRSLANNCVARKLGYVIVEQDCFEFQLEAFALIHVIAVECEDYDVSY